MFSKSNRNLRLRTGRSSYPLVSMIRKPLTLMLLGFLTTTGILGAADAPASAKLDILTTLPGNWDLTPEAFEKHFNAQHVGLFRWLTKDHTRAKLSRTLYSNLEIKLSFLDENISVEEAIVDFSNGKLNLVTLSIFNRGDGGEITAEDFKNRQMVIGKAMSSRLASKAVARQANRQQGLLTEGFSWDSPAGGALLEANEGASTGSKIEFLRLRLARPNAIGALALAMKNTRGGASTRLSDLPANLTRDAEGNVFIRNMPMVDQGNKGYCLPASTQRIFEYYGIGADMHQIAQVSEADPTKGTSAMAMSKELDKIDFRFKTRLMIIAMGAGGGQLTEVKIEKDQYYVGKPVDERKFVKNIKTLIDDGIPLLWALQLGRYPEDPDLKPQTSGGHMRIIIGYNEKSEKIIFTDSWGVGHEFKTINTTHAYNASQGLFALKPTVR